MSFTSNDPPPKDTVKVSEAEVIDPHFRVTFPRPDDWDSWTDDNIAQVINHLSVKLTYPGFPPFIKFSRTYAFEDFKNIDAPFDLNNFDDSTDYYNHTHDGQDLHYLTLFISFPDKDFDKHNEQDWKASIKLAGDTLSGYDGKVIKYQPKRNH